MKVNGAALIECFDFIEASNYPFFSVGDFDSVSKEERQLLTEQLQIKPVQAEKADTDLALAVDKAVALGFDSITIYGATGRRSLFGAIQL